MYKQRYFLEIAYCGTAYHGWQVQANAHTVQAELNQALATIFRNPIETLGAGRTDTGVHARQLYVHFDLNEPLPNRFLFSLNSLLPFDITVQQCFAVSDKAHARFDATSRTYEYLMYATKNPFLRGLACYYPIPLDMEKMNKAATHLLGTHDFSCFSKGHTDTKTNICTITQATWSMRDNVLVFTVQADRFLRGMVRAIVGTLTEVGRDRLEEQGLLQIIRSKKRSEAGESMDPSGLYLIRVDYDFNAMTLNETITRTSIHTK